MYFRKGKFQSEGKGLTRLDIDRRWKDLHDEECQRETDDGGDYVRGEWIEKKKKVG